MATAIEKKCPTCYRKLPDPEFELDYFLWTPGFEWKPEPEPVDEEQDQEYDEAGGPTDEDMAEALLEMVEEDEMKGQFNAVASGGYVDCDTAAVLARKLGLAPSYDDVRRFEEENDSNLNYQGFQKFLAQCTHPEDSLESMVSFFAQYDTTGSGVLTKRQIRNLLTTWGEPLNDQEVDAFVSEFSVGDKVDYRTLCEKIMEKK